MTRNTHDRQLDHHNNDLDSNIELDGGTSSYADGTSLHTVLSGLDARVFDAESGSSASSEAGVISVNCLIGNGSGVIPTGIVYDLVLDFPAQITKWTLLADQSGSLVIDIWKDTYTNFPPLVGDSITASAKPTLSSQTKNTDSTLTGWTKAIAAGDILRLNVDSSATVTRATLALKIQRTKKTTVQVGKIGPNTTILAPQLNQKVTVGVIGPSTTVYAFVLGRVAPPRIGPNTTMFAPTIS